MRTKRYEQELRFYYLSEFYNINEGSLSLSWPSTRFPYYPANLTATHHKLTNITNPSSIAAVRHSSLGTRVYYLDSPQGYWDGEKGYKTANVTEISWRTDDTVWDTQQEINVLSGVAHDSGAALAAVVVESAMGSANDEIHVYYAGPSLNLESLSYLNGSWQEGSYLSSSVATQLKLSITAQTPKTYQSAAKDPFPLSTHEIALSISSLNPTTLSLFYLSSHQVQTGVSITTTPISATNILNAPVVSTSAPSPILPDGIQYPGLVAATSWSIQGNTSSVIAEIEAQGDEKVYMWQSMYYVQRYNGGGYTAVVPGSLVVNATRSMLSGNWSFEELVY